ncbi:hypothetical protein GCM10022214_27850 [Actinomadura miaoliensis]|uniref:Uncharacterized protein n=1 Tax=Actinomadura miaoliensis TaxID=430685 RepID=A0ABP7VN05_9ACTN
MEREENFDTASGKAGGLTGADREHAEVLPSAQPDRPCAVWPGKAALVRPVGTVADPADAFDRGFGGCYNACQRRGVPGKEIAEGMEAPEPWTELGRIPRAPGGVRKPVDRSAPLAPRGAGAAA